MKERPSRKPTRSRRQQATEQPPLPPVVAAVIRFAEPNHDGVPTGFIEAYAAMPRIVAAVASGNDDIETGSLISEISGHHKARMLADKNPDLDKAEPRDFNERHDPARIIAILNRIDEDYPTDLTAPVGNAGFWVGIAFACYVLTNGGAR